MWFLILFAALWPAAWLCLWRIPRCARSDRKGQPPAAARDLSVIVPARNEADNLPVLLGSLSDQGGAIREIIVVDDGSTDRTAAIAREYGATVVKAGPLPEGWRGKTWACTRGAAAASGARLLFVDADTWFAPGALPEMLACHDPGGALSVAPYHVVRRPYEQLSAFFNLMMIGGVGAFARVGRRSNRTGMFGQSLLVARSLYEETGGHADVRGEILENLCLADVYRRRNIPFRCAGGRDCFFVRMYPHGVRELIAGWSKAFVRGAGHTPPLIMALLVAWLTGAAGAAGLTVAALFLPAPASLQTAACLLYAAYAVQIGFLLRRIGSYHPLAAALYPLPLLFYFCVFSRALVAAKRRQDVVWKGRRVAAEDNSRPVEADH